MALSAEAGVGSAVQEKEMVGTKQQTWTCIIIGAGPAGLTLARSLALHSSSSSITTSASASPSGEPSQRKILLLERDLSPSGPDRIVGELLQPGGVHALRSLNLQGALEGIGAVKARGYCVVNTAQGKQVAVPYPDGEEGRSFHHGAFVAALRREVARTPGVTLEEATVHSLLECEHTARVLGVSATPRGASSPQSYLADLVIVADGHASKFRHLLPRAAAPLTRSHFVGLVLHDAHLPAEEHGTVVLIPDQGPVLMYGLAPGDTRILIDVRGKLPSSASGALQQHIRTHVLPHLPAGCQAPLEQALKDQRLRSMPNSWLPPSLQATPQAREGVLLIGDAFNMRHPLTGGGMTVAFTDSLLLGQLLSTTALDNWPAVARALHTFHTARKPLAGTINILSLALYDLFGAASPELATLRQACFDYFLLGGECVKGPVSLLSGLAPRPALLFYHFFAVALYAVWGVLTRPSASASTSHKVSHKPHSQEPSQEPEQAQEHAGLTLASLGRVWEVINLLWVACVVFLPLMWGEVRDVGTAWVWGLVE
ncbi:SE-domain-containing protein [Calocera viscosa TUFC12733]|uniref:Squalene monooxygenase n=1 Tax=Calocera viscosa (strain TUFC12733) TaxID=1330018 RepID=A0A167G1W9_CALVF|nr:SE-domain-containing protein [Calocera viscosa TUFC12733]